jgi:hypothetical protein
MVLSYLAADEIFGGSAPVSAVVIDGFTIS